MHRPQPFARAKRMFSAIAAIFAQHHHTAGAQMTTVLMAALSELGEYESRGKGKGLYSSSRTTAANRRKHQKHMATASRRRRKMTAKHSRRARA